MTSVTYGFWHFLVLDSEKGIIVLMKSKRFKKKRGKQNQIQEVTKCINHLGAYREKNKREISYPSIDQRQSYKIILAWFPNRYAHIQHLGESSMAFPHSTFCHQIQIYSQIYFEMIREILWFCQWQRLMPNTYWIGDIKKDKYLRLSKPWDSRMH